MAGETTGGGQVQGSLLDTLGSLGFILKVSRATPCHQRPVTGSYLHFGKISPKARMEDGHAKSEGLESGSGTDSGDHI